jgi:hypothetical protein
MAREQVIWVDADGGELNLNDWVNYICLQNKNGIWAPPYTVTSTKMPLSEGSQIRSVSVGEGGVDLSLKIRAADKDTLHLLLRDLTYRMDPTRGKGQLKIITDADTRILYCIPEGLKKVIENDRIAETTLSFTANDPFWYSNTEISTEIQNSGSVVYPFFSSSFFPIRLIKSTTYAISTVVNSGSKDVYPVWTITGPGDTIILRNLTTGKTLDLGSLSLAVGQVLEIDTRTLIKTVKVDGDFGDPEYFSYLTKLSSMWCLKKGDNNLSLQMTNSDLNSKIRITFTPRYGSA